MNNFIQTKGKLMIISLMSLAALTLILGILAVALKSQPEIMGKKGPAIGLFESIWTKGSSSIKNHRNFALAGGFIGMITSIVAIITGGLALKNDLSSEPKYAYTIIASTLVALIFSAIALAFNRDLSSATWLATHLIN